MRAETDGPLPGRVSGRYGNYGGRQDQGQLSHVGRQPLHVAAYIEGLQQSMAKPTVKQHLAAIRMLFDSLVTGQVVAVMALAPKMGSAIIDVPAVFGYLDARDHGKAPPGSLGAARPC